MTNKMRLIDANALLRKKYEIYEMGDPEELFSQDFIHKVVSVEDIKNAPTVEIRQVVHGRWEEADDGDGVVCSVCGEDFCNIYLETDRFKYCPNCGAKIKGVRHDG